MPLYIYRYIRKVINIYNIITHVGHATHLHTYINTYIYRSPIHQYKLCHIRALYTFILNIYIYTYVCMRMYVVVVALP